MHVVFIANWGAELGNVNSSLISDLHYLETDGILQQSRNVKVGHSWQTVTGTQQVVAVSQVYEHGVYHLLTPSLTYYADGIAASCLLNFAPHANHSTELYDDVSSLALLFDLMSELAMHCMRNGKHLNSDMYQALLGDDPFAVYADIMQSCAPGVPTNATVSDVPTNATVSDVPINVAAGSLAVGSSWATSLHDVAVEWVELRHPASKGTNWLHSPSPLP